ncbi:MAG: anthranilate phosphoribosyltransferase [Atribacterota bacterium]
MGGKEILGQLANGEKLDKEEAYRLMLNIMEETFTPVQLGAILAMLRLRRESGEELSGFVRAIREKAVPFTVSPSVDVVDNCGTGGDGMGTFNFSTASAILAVGAGVRIVKHGNRAVSSSSGSADFLECLGIPIEAPPQAMQTLFKETGFTFLYAPRYHPAMKVVQGVRRELGMRTVFNLLGPLVNPCRVHYKLVGVYEPGLLFPVGEALLELGVKKGLVVWGEPGIDEVSLAGKSEMVLVTNGKLKSFSFHPQDVGFQTCALSELRGGNPKDNVALFFEILRGKQKGPLRNALLLNAAFLLWLCEQSSSLSRALQFLESILASGQALRTVETIVDTARGMEVAS